MSVSVSSQMKVTVPGGAAVATAVVTPQAKLDRVVGLLCPFILRGDGGWSPERKVTCPLWMDGMFSLQDSFHRWDQRFQSCLEAGKFNLSCIQPGLDPAPLATFE